MIVYRAPANLRIVALSNLTRQESGAMDGPARPWPCGGRVFQPGCLATNVNPGDLGLMLYRYSLHVVYRHPHTGCMSPGTLVPPYMMTDSCHPMKYC